MEEGKTFEVGKAYYSRKLGRVFILTDLYLWYDGCMSWEDADVGVETLDDMVRGIHYRGAMEAAEHLVTLCSQILDKQAESSVE